MCFVRVKKKNRKSLTLPTISQCRHIYEIIVCGVFETELPHITSSPDIPLYKNVQKKIE